MSRTSFGNSQNIQKREAKRFLSVNSPELIVVGLVGLVGLLGLVG